MVVFNVRRTGADAGVGDTVAGAAVVADIDVDAADTGTAGGCDVFH